MIKGNYHHTAAKYYLHIKDIKDIKDTAYRHTHYTAVLAVLNYTENRQLSSQYIYFGKM